MFPQLVFLLFSFYDESKTIVKHGQQALVDGRIHCQQSLVST